MGEGMETLQYVELSSQLLVLKIQWRVKGNFLVKLELSVMTRGWSCGVSPRPIKFRQPSLSQPFHFAIDLEKIMDLFASNGTTLSY